MGLNNFTQGQPKKAPKKQTTATASPLRGAAVQAGATPYQGILPPAAQQPGAAGTFTGPHGPVTVGPNGSIDISSATLSAACAAADAAKQAVWGGKSPLAHPMVVGPVIDLAMAQVRAFPIDPAALTALEDALRRVGEIDFAIGVDDTHVRPFLEVNDPSGGQAHVITIDATTVVWEQASPSGTLTFSRPLSTSVIVDIVEAARAGTTQQFGPVAKP